MKRGEAIEKEGSCLVEDVREQMAEVDRALIAFHVRGLDRIVTVRELNDD